METELRCNSSRLPAEYPSAPTPAVVVPSPARRRLADTFKDADSVLANPVEAASMRSTGEPESLIRPHNSLLAGDKDE